jgi:hypothetical protein
MSDASGPETSTPGADVLSVDRPLRFVNSEPVFGERRHQRRLIEQQQ